MRSPSRTARYILFAALALLAAFAVAGGAWADAAAGLSGAAECAVKLLLILALAAALSFFGPARAPLFSRFPARYWLLALLPPAAVLLAQLRPLAHTPSPAALGGMLLGVVTTALWEELFFRALGQALFLRGDGRYTLFDLLFLSFAFALPHTVNLLIHPVFWQLIWAFCTGLFFLALYRRSGSLLPALVSHALTNALSQTVELCADGAPQPFLGPAADGAAIVGMAVLAAAALALLIRGGLLVRGKEAAR